MKQNNITHIKYTRTTDLGGGSRGDVSDRYIIPMYIPEPNIKAIDVTELKESEQEDMQELSQQYHEYRRAAIEALFDFETWTEHTTGKQVPMKWRVFKPENIEVID